MVGGKRQGEGFAWEGSAGRLLLAACSSSAGVQEEGVSMDDMMGLGRQGAGDAPSEGALAAPARGLSSDQTASGSQRPSGSPADAIWSLSIHKL